MVKRIRAVLFDMDGVLYDSMPNHVVAWTKSMAAYGLKMTKEDAYATEGARGIDTIREMVWKQQHKEITPEEAQSMYDLKTKYFHEMPLAPVFDGVVSLMQQIVAAGMSVNVVTGSGQKPLIKRLLDDFGTYLSPNHITTAYDVRLGKPHPEPYQKGLAKAGCTLPEEGIVIENAPLGVLAGSRAQIYTVAVNTGPLPDKVLLDNGANALYHSMAELSHDFGALIDRICQSDRR